MLLLASALFSSFGTKSLFPLEFKKPQSIIFSMDGTWMKLAFALICMLFQFSLFAGTDYLRVVPEHIRGFSLHPLEYYRMREAFFLMEKVINSETFKERVINFRGHGPLGGFTSNKDLTNEEIYQLIMQGKEVLGGEGTEGEMNLFIQRYSPWYSSAVVGRTFPGTSKWIETNGQHYSYLNPAGMANNLTHEWLHLIGFKDGKKDFRDSVPYAVGNIIEELILMEDSLR